MTNVIQHPTAVRTEVPKNRHYGSYPKGIKSLRMWKIEKERRQTDELTKWADSHGLRHLTSACSSEMVGVIKDAYESCWAEENRRRKADLDSALALKDVLVDLLKMAMARERSLQRQMAADIVDQIARENGIAVRW
ncbi:hypothetical protein AWB71_00924 [Caballeronia peredens]|nr:hypothetical protein AWB71_00924 [Caballeronia peredens]